MKWLVITVGGSSAPIVTAIRTLNPDRVVFICSEDSGRTKGSYTMVAGEGKVCSSVPGQAPDLPNIAVQTNLRPDQYKDWLTLVPPDHLGECYERIVAVSGRIRSVDEHADIFADYTGGTKSMTAAIAMSAVDDGRIQLRLVTGLRRDQRAVTVGEYVMPARVTTIRVRRVVAQAEQLVIGCQYAAAATALAAFMADNGMEESLADNVNLLRALDAWDRFDYHDAARLLSCVQADSVAPHKRAAAMLSRLGEKAWQDKNGYLLVRDLLANAGRRAAQGRYEDAIARHYRAVELTVQIYLYQGYDLETAAVPKDKIPAELNWKPDDGLDTVQIGLRSSWDLAAALDDGIKAFYKSWEGRLLQAISRRNNSLGAHGTTPASEVDYREDCRNGMAAFVHEALSRLDPDGQPVPDFPQHLNLEFNNDAHECLAQSGK